MSLNRRQLLQASGAAMLQAADAALRLTLSRDGRTIATRQVGLASQGFQATLALDRPELWSPQRPNLYELVIELVRDGVVIDSVERIVGFRRFEAKDGRLWLNGEPFYMFGALDQDWTEDANWPPNGSGVEERFRNAKAMGLNTLRCHVKIPDQEYLDLADRLGLVVWLDMPYPGFLAPETRETVKHVFRQSVTTHGFHPSICIWTLFNEGWGIELDDNPDDRCWLIALFNEAKALVPNALVVDNSPCFPRNYHMKTDIEDFHWYNGFPHQNEAFAATSRAFAARAAFPWSPHRRPGEEGRVGPRQQRRRRLVGNDRCLRGLDAAEGLAHAADQHQAGEAGTDASANAGRPGRKRKIGHGALRAKGARRRRWQVPSLSRTRFGGQTGHPPRDARPRPARQDFSIALSNSRAFSQSRRTVRSFRSSASAISASE